jgi:hypothetical protein
VKAVAEAHMTRGRFRRRRVVIDANVLVSFFVDRIEKQRDAADELLQKAEDGEIAAIPPAVRRL